MKKTLLIVAGIILLITLVLFLPIPQGTYDDGGTRVYNALTYKIVVWNRLVPETNETGSISNVTTYHKTSVFWYPDNQKSIDELWKIEKGISVKPDEEYDANNIDTLREKFPEYFDLDTFKGLEVYVWPMAENYFRCGVLSGTNRNKTNEELWGLANNSTSIEQMKTILSTYDIPAEDIVIIAYSQPISSYSCIVDNDYIKKLSDLFDNKYIVIASN